MKKILAILMVAVLLSTVVFAQIEPSVEATAKLTWGIDFGAGKDATPTHGFENHLEAKVEFPIYSGAFHKESDDDVQVHFNIDAKLKLGVEIDRHNATGDSEKFKAPFDSKLEKLHASLHFFGAYITVYDRPSFSTNFAKLWPAIGARPWNTESHADSSITGFGTKIGYKNGNIADTGIDLDVGLKFGSNGAWNSGEGKKPAGKEKKYEEIKFAAVTDKVKEGEYFNLVILPNPILIDGKVIDKAVGASVVKVTSADVAAGKTAGDVGLAADTDYYLVTEKEGEQALNSKYAFGFDLNFKYDKYVYLDFGMNLTFDPQNKYSNAKSNPKTNAELKNFALGFAVGTKAVEGLNVRLGLDTILNVGSDKDSPKTAVDMSFTADYKWVGFGIYYANKYTDFKGTNKDAKDTDDIAMKIAFSSADSGDTNFVDGLAFGIDFRLNHLLTYIPQDKKDKGATIPMGFKFWTSYKYNISDSMWIKPYFTLWGETNSASYKDDTPPADQKSYFGVAYKIGLEFGPMEKVVVFLDWAHGKPKASYVNGIIGAPVQHKNHNGTLTMGMKLIY